MLYRDFGRTGWKVSAIAQGCWNIGNQEGEMTDEAADRIIKTAYDCGMNLFDVAEILRHSQRHLRDSPRESRKTIPRQDLSGEQDRVVGKYDEDTVFTDTIRQKWNQGEENRTDFATTTLR